MLTGYCGLAGMADWRWAALRRSIPVRGTNIVRGANTWLLPTPFGANTRLHAGGQGRLLSFAGVHDPHPSFVFTRSSPTLRVDPQGWRAWGCSSSRWSRTRSGCT